MIVRVDADGIGELYRRERGEEWHYGVGETGNEESVRFKDLKLDVSVFSGR